MSLSLYDTHSREIRPVRPMDGETLRFYCCGPTVYGPAHIGNFRTFVMQDVFRRGRSNVFIWLRNLPDSVIRAKALLTLTTHSDSRFLYERVGQVISTDPITVPKNGKVPCAGVFLGPDLDPEELLQVSREYLHPDCHFPLTIQAHAE